MFYYLKNLFLKIESDDIVPIEFILIFINHFHNHIAFLFVLLEINNINIFSLTLRIEERSFTYFAFKLIPIDSGTVCALLNLYFIPHPYSQTIDMNKLNAPITFARSNQLILLIFFTK